MTTTLAAVLCIAESIPETPENYRQIRSLIATIKAAQATETAAEYQAILTQAAAQTLTVQGVTEQARMRGITAVAEKP